MSDVISSLERYWPDSSLPGFKFSFDGGFIMLKHGHFYPVRLSCFINCLLITFMLLKTIKSKKSFQNKGCWGLRNLPCPEIKAVGQQPARLFSVFGSRAQTVSILNLSLSSNWAFLLFTVERIKCWASASFPSNSLDFWDEDIFILFIFVNYEFYFLYMNHQSVYLC